MGTTSDLPSLHYSRSGSLPVSAFGSVTSRRDYAVTIFNTKRWNAASEGIMEVEPDIENMTLNEYLEYEAEMKRQSDTNHESGNILNFPNFPATNEFSRICEQDVDLEKEDDQEDDSDAPATKSILDELLEEFGDEIMNVTMVDEEVDSNPTRDIEELERLLAKDPQSHFIEIQVVGKVAMIDIARGSKLGAWLRA
ncbi:hypothetical protein Tco_1055600 [Tanacetum coccineum]|uniref:Uncharacterized protein n=1 Tax=Tanacetum coccineum TaxID=301880 RepID=A0ABQ5H045_9ASTR